MGPFGKNSCAARRQTLEQAPVGSRFLLHVLFVRARARSSQGNESGSSAEGGLPQACTWLYTSARLPKAIQGPSLDAEALLRQVKAGPLKGSFLRSCSSVALCIRRSGVSRKSRPENLRATGDSKALEGGSESYISLRFPETPSFARAFLDVDHKAWSGWLCQAGDARLLSRFPEHVVNLVHRFLQQRWSFQKSVRIVAIRPLQKRPIIEHQDVLGESLNADSEAKSKVWGKEGRPLRC